MSNYARRVPGGRTHHLVTKDGTATKCGEVIGSGWAVWPASLMPRVDHAPLCDKCRKGA